MLINVFGNLGSGKTLLLTAIAVLNPKRKVVSNFHLKREYEEFSIDKFMKSSYHDCIIFLDEGYTYLDSRLSMSTQNRLMSYTLFQSRKKSVEIYITMQLTFSLDIRYRELADYNISCTQLSDGFEYIIFRPNDVDSFANAFLSLEMAQQFFPVYDTNEVIQSGKDSIVFLSNSEKLEKIKKLSEEVLAEYKENPVFSNGRKLKISKSYLKIWLMKKGLEQDYTNLLYDYCVSKTD